MNLGQARVRIAMERRLIETAAEHGLNVAPTPEEWGYCQGWAFLVRRHPDTGYHVVVALMMFNWRILECHDGGYPTGRFWCYPRSTTGVWLETVRQAATYQEEPTGWIKSHQGPSDTTQIGQP